MKLIQLNILIFHMKELIQINLIALGIQGDTIKVQLNIDKDEYSFEILQSSKIKGSIATGLRTQHFRVKA